MSMPTIVLCVLYLTSQSSQPFFMSQKSWFRPKAYCHLTKKLVQRDEAWIKKYVSDPSNIIKHKFFPLIHRTIATKRYKNSEDRKGRRVKRHYTIKEQLRVSNVKYREIYYANHLDAHIYSYYTKKILEPLYDKELKKSPALNDAVLAYRSVPILNSSRCKSNIDFADEVFEMIKGTKGKIAVIALDISKFFDSLDHKRLKRVWARLLNRVDLPQDHYQVFKSLTQFSFVELKDLLSEFGFNHPNELIQNDEPYFLSDGHEFRERIKKKGYLKKNPFRGTDNTESNKRETIGIPQGTPISAFLANLYLLDFDKMVISELEKYGALGIYRRYSDDILVICPKEANDEIESFLYQSIQEFKLTIQPSKTQRSFFNNARLEKGQQPLTYLGFQFDGHRKRIKPGSLAKFYRKMKSSVKFRAYKAHLATLKMTKGKVIVDATLHRKKLYQQFSILGASRTSPTKRNYFSYAQSASSIMKSPEINKQLAKAWHILHSEIAKQEARRNLPSIKLRHKMKI